jgi:hypothetical protein
MLNKRKKVKISLEVFFIFLVLTSGAMVCMAFKGRDDYKNATQGIYEQMKTFSFTFDGQPIQYAVYFGGMFEPYNDTHKRFTADVFVIALTENYVSNLAASLTYDLTFSATGLNINTSGSETHTSQFVQFNDVIYSFQIYEFYAHKNLFPVSLSIEFDYHLISAEFDVSDSYSITKNFDWDPMFIIIIIGSTIGIIAAIVVITILIVVIRKRKRRTKITG